jgi:hypothetical protein
MVDFTLISSSIAPPQLETPTASSFVQPALEEEISYPLARVLFTFKATSEFELSVNGAYDCP